MAGTGCPQPKAGDQASVGNPASDLASAPDEAGSIALSSGQPQSPLDASAWDGMTHQYALADFCRILLDNGAADLLLHADFSTAQYSVELESATGGDVPIGVWLLPEEEATPVGFQAQLIAFGEGRRLIFGFSAAWYEQHMGLAPEELDAQFRSMHEEHGGVLKNYAYADPDYDISFFQFNFDNADESQPWGSPYMTHKRFTMHGDVPEWNFYCIGINAGASLATRRSFEAEAAREDVGSAELPGLDPAQQPDALLAKVALGGTALLEELGPGLSGGERLEGFSLERLLKPRTLSERYTLSAGDAAAFLELILAERSQVQRLSFTDAWLLDSAMDTAAFNARFEELHTQYGGWTKVQSSAEQANISDSGVIIGSWELSRRLIDMEDEPQVRSWSINPAAAD
jgi:hypothetical protein